MGPTDYLKNGGGFLGGFGGLGGLGLSGGASFLLPMLLGQFMRHNDPMAQTRERAMGLFTPGNLLGSQNQFYGQNISSAPFGQSQAMAIQSGQALSNLMARNAASAGLTHGGLNNAFQAMGKTYAGNRLGQSYTDAWGQAGNQAQNSAQAQFQALMGTISPNYNANLMAGGLNAFMPYLFSMLTKQNPAARGGGY